MLALKGRPLTISARSLLSLLVDCGATAGEVFWKEGCSLRLSVSSEGEIVESFAIERGVALRAWGAAGGMGFASFVPEDQIAMKAALDRIREEMRASGEGPPDLPAVVPGPGSPVPPHVPAPLTQAPTGHATGFLALEGTGSPMEWAENLRDSAREALEAFERPGREALRLEGGWWEAGESRSVLLNSSGFEGLQSRSGWHVALAARASRGGEARIGYLGRDGTDPGTLKAEALVSELAWRTAAPLGGEPPPAGRTHAVIDSAIASQLVRSLSPALVANEESLDILRRGEPIGPPSLRIEELPSGPERWDGEGVARNPVRLVEEGRIVNLLTDLDLSRRFGLPRTGSARRVSFRDPPLAAPTRLILRLPGCEQDMETLIGRMAPGLFLTTARFVPSDTGSGGAIIGGGVWTQDGRAIRPVRGAVLAGGPLQVLASLIAASPPQAGWAEAAECGSLLILSDVLPS